MLLDTDVMVDVARGHAPALQWLASLGATAIGLPGLVVMELLQGCRNAADQARIEGLVTGSTHHWPTAADARRAVDDLASFRLSHGLGLLDSLIGQTAVGVGVPLATFNVKHFAVMTGLVTIQPY